MTSFVVTRPTGVTVQDRIKAAVTVYYQARRAMPAGIAVNPCELGTAVVATAALGLKIPVEGMGGCLIPEIWLEVPDVA